jgi:hypothetical protein
VLWCLSAKEIFKILVENWKFTKKMTAALKELEILELNNIITGQVW